MSDPKQPEVKTPEVKVQFPALDPAFFEVLRTAIQNTAWKRSLFPLIEKVEGQLNALEKLVDQIRSAGIPINTPSETEDGVGIDIPVAPKVEVPAPEIVPAPVEEVEEEVVDVLPEQEKKN